MSQHRAWSTAFQKPRERGLEHLARGWVSRAYRCPQAWLGLDACSTHTAWLVPRAVHTPRPASGDVGLALPPSLEADRREGHLSLPGVASSANAQFTRGNRASVSA